MIDLEPTKKNNPESKLENLTCFFEGDLPRPRRKVGSRLTNEDWFLNTGGDLCLGKLFKQICEYFPRILNICLSIIHAG